MAAYRRVYDSRHLQADCKHRDQLRKPTLSNRVWATFIFFNHDTNMYLCRISQPPCTPAIAGYSIGLSVAYECLTVTGFSCQHQSQKRYSPRHDGKRLTCNDPEVKWSEIYTVRQKNRNQFSASFYYLTESGKFFHVHQA